MAGSPLTDQTQDPIAGDVWVGQMNSCGPSSSQRTTLSGWLPTKGVGHHVTCAVSVSVQAPNVTVATNGPPPMELTTYSSSSVPPTLHEMWSMGWVMVSTVALFSHKGSGQATSRDGGSMG